MTTKNPTIEIRSNAHLVFDQYRSERRHNLVGPEDDMWATFADIAEPHALVVNQEVVGCCSIDADNRLHAFHVTGDAQELAPAILDHVVHELNISSAMPSTVDPGFLSLCLTAGGRAESVGLMYEHIADPLDTRTVDVRPASSDDHHAAVAFYEAETGSPREFQEGYLAERISRGELHLVVDTDGRITATGECRIDLRTDKHAHLGLVVGADSRNQGVGSRLIHTLAELAHAEDLLPLCSTEPTNRAAQRVIHRAGFRTRHRVFQVAMTAPA